MAAAPPPPPDADDNPIVDEIRQARDQLLGEAGGDLSTYLTDMRQRTEASARAGRTVVTRPPRLASPPQPVPRKAG